MEVDDYIDDEPPRKSSKSSKSKNKKSKISEKEILSIINDIFLTNYWCTRQNMTNITSDYIVGLNEIKQWSDYFDNVNFKEINRISVDDHRKNSNKKFNIEEIESFLKYQCTPVYNILHIGKGKISLCGGAIISILRNEMPNDYDLFFHSDSVDEIDDIFNECLDELNKISSIADIRYSRSKYLMNVNVEYGDFYGDLEFIKRVYKTKEQVLFGFDLAPCRIGYNPKDGIFATICGAMAFAMNAFAMDSSNRSTSFGHRLDKYSYKKYSILLPQLQSNMVNNRSIELFDNIKIGKPIRNDNSFLIESFSITKDDYESNNDNLNYLINKDYDNLTFSSNDLKLILELSDDFIEKEMVDKNIQFTQPSSKDITKKYAKEFLDDKYKEFALAYFIDEDDEKADSIWQEKVKYYIELTKEVVKNNDKNYYKGWKYLNPGSRWFGQNHPINNPPTEYYKPLVVGISMEKFQAFMDCRKNIEYISNLPNEIFKLICDYWLKYDVEDARQRLFSCMINDKKELKIKDLELTWDKATICDVSFY